MRIRSSPSRATRYSISRVAILGPLLFTVEGSTLYAAAQDGGIYVSDDGGAIWRLRYREAA